MKAALRNGQLEEIRDEDMLSCWSCEAGDRKLALALLEAFSQSIPWSASASAALDAVLGTDEAKPPSKKKRRSLTNSRTSPKKTPVVKTTLGSEKCATYLLATFLQACCDNEVDDAENDRVEGRCLAALSMDCAAVAVRFLPRLSLGDGERSRLFAALLGLLKRDDLQVKRTDVQAACSAIANKNDWPRAWAARNRVTSSEASKPPLSAMIAGKARNARAKPSMAKAFLPGVFGTSASMARAIRVSQHPPPGIVLVSLTVLDRTQRASCKLLSASSRT